MTVATYPAIVRNGKVELTTPLLAPEGSEVYVVPNKPKVIVCLPVPRWYSPIWAFGVLNQCNVPALV